MQDGVIQKTSDYNTLNINTILGMKGDKLGFISTIKYIYTRHY